MTEEELIGLSRDRPSPHRIIWSENVYGLGKWLKRYAGVPDDLPLCAQIDHGPSNWEVPHKMDLESQAPVLLFHHRRSAEVTMPHVPKPCLVMGSPFVHCRWLNGFRISPDARGTVAFPVHSTHHTTTDMDWRAYCRELRRLPAAYHPVTICMYWKDILNGTHKVFMEEGFEVVTAGHMYDEGFPERFYRILSRHRHATGNDLGSQAFYALEMGLSYFLWGEQQFSWYNSGGEAAYPKGKMVWKDLAAFYQLEEAGLEGLQPGDAARLRRLLGSRAGTIAEFQGMLASAGVDPDSPLMRTAVERAKKPFGRPWDRSLFLEPRERVTAGQKAFVARYLGLKDALPPRSLREVLWRASEVMLLNQGRAGLDAFCRTDCKPVAAPGRQPCPACGTFEAEAREISHAQGPDAAEAFEICRECGTGFRSAWTMHPSASRRSLEVRPASGRLPSRLVGLDEVEEPVGALREAAEKQPGEVLITVPSLGAEGLSAQAANAGIRTLFTVTGLRYALLRSGMKELSVWQDGSGMLQAVAMPGAPDTGLIVAPWDPVANLPGRLDPGRGRANGTGAGVFAPVLDLAGRDLQPTEREALLPRLYELIRAHPCTAPLLRAAAILHARAGEWAKAGQWLGLCTEHAGPEDYPRSELVRLHAALGLDRYDLPGEVRVQAPASSAADEADGSAERFVRILELIQEDRDAEALAEIEASLAVGEPNPDFRFARSVVLRRLGRTEAAVAVLADLVRTHPEMSKAREMLEELSSGRG